MRVIFKRLRSGQEIREELIKLTKKEKIKGGVLLALVGAAKDLHLRNIDPEIGNKTPKVYPEKHEIVAASGTLSQDGVHIHITAANAKTQKLVGGHLRKASVFATVEIVVLETGIKLRREFDKETGFKELVVG